MLCNEYNRKIVDEFLKNSTQLSKQTIKSYRSNLMIWFNYVKENLDNKPQTEIKSRDYMFYQNWLINLNHSSSDIKNKRAAVSSLNNYIVLFYSDIYPMFKNFIVRGMPQPEKSFVHEKKPPNKEEFNHLINELKKREEWQKVAWLMVSYTTGCRRAESRQLLKEIAGYDPIVKTKESINDDGKIEIRTSTFYLTHKVRCKGRGRKGSVRPLCFDVDTMVAIKKWIEVRGNDDCPYLFVAKNSVNTNQISESSLNSWCNGLFSDIVGRRIHPHIFRESRASVGVLEEGRDIKSISRLLGHKSEETTKIYIIGDTEDDDMDDLFY